MPMSRRQFTIDAVLAGLGFVIAPRLAWGQDEPAMVVYKSPSCGCCGKWVDHIKASGFAVSVTNLDDLSAIKSRYHVGSSLQSCHTAVVGGYVVEGHVPAADIKRMLASKPKIVGLTIPGMPASAPGMDMTPFQPYDVLAFDQAGATTVFAKHTK